MKYKASERILFPKIIRQSRELLEETQVQYGARFDKTAPIVSLWEAGKRKAPYEVLSFALTVVDIYEICPTCKGKGIVEKDEQDK